MFDKVLDCAKKMTQLVAVLAMSTTQVWTQQEPLDLDMVNKIRDQGFNHSEVFEITGYLSDVIGPRMPATPAMNQANNWTMEKFRQWGLESHLEGFEFGPGWTYKKSIVRMTAPRLQQLQAMPISWFPGTGGVIRGEAVLVVIESKEDFEKFDDGMLEGKVVLITSPESGDIPPDRIIVRWDEENLKEVSEFEIPAGEDEPDDYLEEQRFRAERDAFLKEQGAIAIVNRTDNRDGAMISAEGSLPLPGETRDLPGITMTWEDYGRITRLLGRGLSVELELDIEVEFHDEDTKIYNTIAEIPGRGRNPEIVIAGAHLDSWFMGDGAVDNATGSAVVMEAARILMALDIKPKRTIRFALWAAEEQGLLGAAYHVITNFADKPTFDDPDVAEVTWDTLLSRPGPIRKKADYDRLSIMFNLDTGTGRIRGVWGEGNAATKPIFERWLEPFHDIGAATVTMSPTSGTDHQAFDWVGLPGFTFMQDRLDYDTRLHHTQIDTMDHVSEADLKQAAVVMASFLYHAAMREERMPRKPLVLE